MMSGQIQTKFQVSEEKQNGYKGQKDSIHVIVMSYFDAMDVLLKEVCVQVGKV